MKIFRTIFFFFWNLSIGKIYRILFKRKARACVLPTKDFLLSEEYQKIMNELLPYNGEYGKHESYTYTRSYINRHHTYEHLLGVFRWRGMQENLNVIIPLISDSSKVVVDFGGGGSPLGFDSILVDRLKIDKLGRRIKIHNLDEIEGHIDVLFASHVFEHIQELDIVLKKIFDKMISGGFLICFVPSFSNPYWNAGDHQHYLFGRHVWTMGLSKTDRNIVSKIPFYMDIDLLIGKYFEIEKAEYCGDDCIYILAKKNDKWKYLQ
jgi:hypothetical protein